MPANCSQCYAANPTKARFCQSCGALMSGGLDDVGTIVAQTPPGPGNPTPVDIKTIIASTQKNLIPPLSGSSNHINPQPLQREITILVIDVSGSMGFAFDQRFTKLEATQRAYQSMLVHKFQIDPLDEVGVVEFDSEGRIVSPILQLQQHKRDLLAALQSLQVKGGTDINKGLMAAERLFDWHRSSITRRIVLLTDGQGGYPIQTAERLKGKGVVIEAVGVGNTPASIDEPLLRRIASVIQGETRYWFLKNSQTLLSTMTALGEKTQIGG